HFRQAREAVDTYLTQVSQEQLLHQPGLQPLQEKLLRSALRYYQSFAEQYGDDPSLQVELAEAYLRWGSILATVGSGAERDKAKEALHQAIAIFERLEQARPGDEQVRGGLARSLHQLAYVQIFGNEPAEGEQTARRAVGLLEELWAAHPEVNEYGPL